MSDETGSPQPVNRFCASCGSELTSGARFCGKCGAAVSADQARGAVRAPAQPVAAAADYTPGTTLATWLSAFFAVTMLISIAVIAANAAHIDAINRLEDGDFFAITDLEDAQDAKDAVDGISVLATIVIAVVFLIWFYRMHKNLVALRATDTRWSPWWAVGGFFIPFANLVIPYLVAEEIWRASSPNAEHLGDGWKKAPGSGLIKSWWAFWILGGVLGASGVGFAFDEDRSLESFRTEDTILIVLAVLSIIAAVLAIMVVRSLSKRQEERLLLVQSTPRTGAAESNPPPETWA